MSRMKFLELDWVLENLEELINFEVIISRSGCITWKEDSLKPFEIMQSLDLAFTMTKVRVTGQSQRDALE
jgi:hypothetical protein